MQDETHQNAIQIAVLKEQVIGIREQQKAHADATSSRFNSVDEKLETLIATLNKGKGAYAVLFLISGLIGAAVIQAISWVAHKVG